ncbi:MAG: DUF4123 domain-containing protein [Paracoccus sp. (in: a-proteobacteria)]|nr:DUF4123 domain-containing protein [Paracoccus sp. (in: a-proteobacteria)]
MFDLTRIEGISPMRPELGHSPSVVSDQLRDVLFGCGKDGSFAVLDAASLDGLPELLSASELECECLFRGKAAEELGAVAPWLVRLEPENMLTRRLFTLGPAPWHLWGKISGSYLRFDGSCRDLAAHLRRFTRLPDQDGKWYYFRYWDPAVMAVILNNPTESLSGRFLEPLSAVTALFANRSTALHLRRRNKCDEHGHMPIRLTPEFQALLAAASESRFDDKLRRHLARHDPSFSRLPDDEQIVKVKQAVTAAEFYDIRIEAAVARFARIYLTAPPALFSMQPVRDIMTSPRHEMDRVGDLARYCRMNP